MNNVSGFSIMSQSTLVFQDIRSLFDITHNYGKDIPYSGKFSVETCLAKAHALLTLQPDGLQSCWGCRPFPECWIERCSLSALSVVNYSL